MENGMAWHDSTHSTGPSSFSLAFVSVSGVVEANSHTLPFRIFTAVDLSNAWGQFKAHSGENAPNLPPTGKMPKRANGLTQNVNSYLAESERPVIPGKNPHIFGNLDRQRHQENAEYPEQVGDPLLE